MKLKSQILLGMNALVIGSMAGVFYVHMNEQNRKFEELRSDINQQVQEIAREAEESRIKAEKAAARVDFVKQRDCLATNIYHEAGIEGDQGKRGVAWATLNRVASDKYPDTVCEVVYQANTDEDGDPIKNECQFSWYCDGKSDEIKSMSSWNRSLQIATEVMEEFGREADPTGGAIMYHADYVDPFWVASYERTVQIDTHIFYRKRNKS